MSIVAFPSGSVFTSRFPMSLPSLNGLKMTAAFMMGFPLNFLVTCTVIFEVSGGGLYLRPRFIGESCARRLEAATKAVTQTRAMRDLYEWSDSIMPFILRRYRRLWLARPSCASFTHISSQPVDRGLPTTL